MGKGGQGISRLLAAIVKFPPQKKLVEDFVFTTCFAY